MTALTLYEIAQEHLQLAKTLADMDVDPQTLADTLEGDLAAFDDKARAVACVMANMDAEIEAYEDHIAKVSAKSKSLKARQKWLQDYLLANMQAVGVTEVKGPAISVKIVNNPESVEIYDAAQIPEEFMRQPNVPEKQPAKDAIKDAIKSGREVSGARITRTQRLKISF